MLQANGDDLAFITVDALDAQSRLQPNADQEVSFALTGPGEIIAVGNGDGSTRDSYRGDHIALFYGRALVVVRTFSSPGKIHVIAHTAGLKGAQVQIQSIAAKSRSALEP